MCPIQKLPAEPLVYELLAPIDVIWCQGRIRTLRSDLYRLLPNSGRNYPFSITSTHSLDIADVVTQQRYRAMHPIPGCNPSLAQVFPLENRLTDQRHHYRVFHIVIKRIRVRDILERQPPRPRNDVREWRLHIAVGSSIRFLEFFNKIIDRDLPKIQHILVPFGYRL